MPINPTIMLSNTTNIFSLQLIRNIDKPHFNKAQNKQTPSLFLRISKSPNFENQISNILANNTKHSL